jgi:hypothetical protein
MKQPDLRSLRYVDTKQTSSPKDCQRPRSEPANLGHSQWEGHEDNGRSKSRLLALFHTDRSPPTFPLGSALATFNPGGDRAVVYENPLEPSGNRRAEPRVVQPMVAPSESTLKDPEVIYEERSAAREASSHPTSPMTDRAITLMLPQPSSRPGPGPGPGPGPKKNGLPLLRAQGDSTLALKRTVRSLDREWEEIRKLRARTRSLRSRIQVLRRELRLKQEARSSVDDRLLKYYGLVISLKANNANRPDPRRQEALSTLLEDYQRARDEYGPSEDDCNILEDQLDQDEFELTKREERFYSHDLEVGIEELPLSSPVDLALLVPSIWSDEVTLGEYHPLVKTYLSSMGDLDILQERLADHRNEKYSLELEKGTRKPLGLTLSADDEEWLDHYEAMENELLQEIKTAEEEADRIKKQCLEAGLVDEDGDPISLDVWEQRNFLHEDIDAGSATSEFTKFPALLPRPGTAQIHLKASDAEADVFFDNTYDRINHWLLAHLRSSPLDVNLLARTYEAQFGPIKFSDDWQEHVLTLWYEDGTRKGVHEYRIYSSVAGSQARPGPLSPDVVEIEEEPLGIVDKPFLDPNFNYKSRSVPEDGELRLLGLSSGTFPPKEFDGS